MADVRITKRRTYWPARLCRSAAAGRCFDIGRAVDRSALGQFGCRPSYLPTVLAVAVRAGFGPAVAAAVSSAFAYNYFFTAPYRTLRIHSPDDILTVIVLFLVALVTSRLAARMRHQARLAQAHAERNATIAGLAWRLLSGTSEREIAEVAVNELARLFDCNAILLADQPQPRILAAQPASIQLTPGDIAAAATVIASGEATGRGLSRSHDRRMAVPSGPFGSKRAGRSRSRS